MQMNILKSEEHNMLVRAALIEGSGNPGLMLTALANNKLLLPDGKLNRRKIIAIIRRDPNDLRRLPGIGRSTYIDIIKMLLETV